MDPHMTQAKTPTPPSPSLPWAKHVVCFWRQNDLALFGRRPDRWIEFWRRHPGVEKVLVFERPVDSGQLQQMLRLSVGLEPTSGSEFRLLLNLLLSKHQGQLDDEKVLYKTFITAAEGRDIHAAYLRWVMQTMAQAGMEAPLLMLWPACFVNGALLEAMRPCETVTDLVDDQRLAHGQEALRPTIERQYDLFLQRSQRVVAGSTLLAQRFSADFGRTVEYMPNALLGPLVSTQNRPAAATSRRTDRLVVGYAGNLRQIAHHQPLLQVVQRHADKDFWFLGQTHGSRFYQEAGGLLNCRFWGTLSQTETQALLAQVDVLILPFKDEPMPYTAENAPLFQQGRLPLVPLQGLEADRFERLLLQALEARRAR